MSRTYIEPKLEIKEFAMESIVTDSIVTAEQLANEYLDNYETQNNSLKSRIALRAVF